MSVIDPWVIDYGGAPLPFVLALFSIIFLIPTSWVQNVRLSQPYKGGVRWLKLKALPLVFVVAFVWFAIAIANHYLFSIRDGAGHFCTPSAQPISPPEEKTITLYFDIATNRRVDVSPEGVKTTAGDSELCFATGLRLQRGREYLFSIEPLEGSRWKFWGSRSGTGGVSVFGYPIAKATGDSPWTTGFVWWKRLIMPFLYPLRRTLDRPWGSVVTRFGPDGNEENFIDPEGTPQRNEIQSERLRPGRSGELFIYLNKPHFGICGTEHWLTSSINGSGIAKVTVKLEKDD